MSSSPYVTVREAAQILGISEGKLMTMTENNKLVAYKIAGQFIRFKREDILALKSSGDVTSETIKFPYTPNERVRDFFAYNDFYILAFIVIVVLLSIIFFIK